MPKRRKKRRGKRREPQQQLPRPNRGSEPSLRPDAVLPTTVQTEQTVASPSLDDNDTGKAADRTIVGTVLEVEREFIWIETEGARAKLYASELMLDIGEVPEDRYAPGDRFEAFVCQMGTDPDSGALQFSIRRAAPYLDALNRIEVGSVVANATVVNTYDAGIELDIDGVRGNTFSDELPLGSGESTHDRYQPGDTIHDLFVRHVNHNARLLSLSVRRNAPGYVEALNAHSVGDVVSATVTDVYNDGELLIDLDGVIGYVAPDELVLDDDESAQDRYAIGDTVDDLFVWQINNDRSLNLSVRRNTPGYVEALNAHSVGEVVSATVTAFGGRGLWLDVGGAVGWVGPQDLSLTDGKSAQDRYAVGDTVHDLLVWQINDNRSLELSVKRNAPRYVEAFNAHSVGEVVSATVTVLASDGGLWLDVDGAVGAVGPQELALADGESAQDRYAVGDTVHDLFVWQINDARRLALSVRRNAPGYVEALNAHSVGDVVSATITAFQGNGGLWLDVDGVIGSVEPQELALADGETAQDRYAVGDTVHDLFVWQVDQDARSLRLSVRRNTPGYVEALNAHSVGDVVSAAVTAFGGRGLWLDVDGTVGWVGPQELALADGESVQDRYAVGDTVHDLFVRLVTQDDRVLHLSARRNAPGYVEAFNAHSVGEVVSATVTAFGGRGLWLDVGGVVGWVGPQDLSLAVGETAQDRYAVGDTVHDLFVWQIDNDRSLNLSVRRNAPGYVEALNARSVGEVVSATVTVLASDGGLRLDVGGAVGWVGPQDLSLADGESAQDRYAGGDTVDDLFVWQVNHDARHLVLSVRRNAPGYVEALNAHSVGEVISGTITVIQDDGGLWLDVGGVVGWVGPQDLSLADGESAQDRYAVSDTVHDLFVWQVDRDTRDLDLSARRNAPGYVEAFNAHSVGEVVSATVTAFGGRGLWLDVGGAVGWVGPQDLSLAADESAQDRYAVGDTVHDLFVWQVSRDARELALSVRRNAPGYVEALNAHSVGEVVSATVTGFEGSGGLWLDVGGVVGYGEPFGTASLEPTSSHDQHAVGDRVNMIVGGIDRLDRSLALVVLLDGPELADVLAKHNIGDVVAGIVTEPDDADGIILDVEGLVGFVPPWELPPTDDGQPQGSRYAVGDVVEAVVFEIVPEVGTLWLSVKRRNATYVDALTSHSVGDPVVATVVFVESDALWLDVSGVSAMTFAVELPLARGQSPLDRYAPGDTLNGFVAGIDEQSRMLGLSTRRPGRAQRRQRQRVLNRAARRRGAPSGSSRRRGAQPGSPIRVAQAGAAAVHRVGDTVSGTVKRFTSMGVILDVDGKFGVLPFYELDLTKAQSAIQKYLIGDVVEASVTALGLDGRVLALSVRSSGAEYADALAAHKVGQIVSGVVTLVYGENLVVNVDGVTGTVRPDELPEKHDAGSMHEHHAGDTVEAVVLGIDLEHRRLTLSLRRVTEDYLASLAKHNVGDIVSGVVREANPRGILLDVDGVVGRIAANELDLTDGETPHGQYSIGDTVEAFCWQIYRPQRRLELSIRRRTAGYAEALSARSVDEVVSGTVTGTNEFGIWLRVGSLAAWIAIKELPLAAEESPKDRYSDGDSVKARVWQIYVKARHLILSVQRLAPERMAEPIALGEPIDVSVVQDTDSGITVLFKGREIQIPNYTLSLSVGDRPIFEPRSSLSVVVMAMDDYGQPTVLSYRRSLESWRRAVDRLAPNMIVQDAEVIPWAARPEGETRAMLDLGPITGFVAETERDAEAAEALMKSRGNRKLPVVITALDKAVGIAEVSHEKFAARWDKLAASVSVGQSRRAELRRVTRDKAILDLGSGLQAEMPRDQIPTIEHAGEHRRAREGDAFTVLIIDKSEAERIIVAEHPNQWLVNLIAADESMTCEFKAVYRGPNRKSERQYVREVRSGLPVLRAMAALMNQEGGYVLVGVEDTDKKAGGVIGWQDSGLPNQNSLRNDLSLNVSNNMLAPAARTSYDANFYVLPTGEEVLAIKCERATVPIYLKNTLDDRYEFPLRRDAGTQVAWPLDEEEQMRELRRHFTDRWPDEDPEVLWSDFQRRVRARPSED